MTEFINTNLLGTPTWFYRVHIYVTAFDEKGECVNSYEHTEDSDQQGLPEQRKAAFNYYNDSLDNFPGRFVYPYISRKEYQANPRAHARYSIDICLVCWYDEDNFEENFIVGGENEVGIADGLTTEKLVWSEQGLPEPPAIVHLGT